MDNQDKVTLDNIGKQAANEAHQLFTYGSLIDKEWLVKAFRMKEPATGTLKDFNDYSFEFMQNMDEFRQVMLTEYKMALDNVRGKGYMIVVPSQQSDLALRELSKDVRRAMKRANDVLVHVNIDLLSSDDIKRRDENMAKMAQLRLFNKKQLKFKE